jgi:hypothetical protein
MIVLVHREAVRGVDDSAPFAKAVHVPDSATLAEFLKMQSVREYLPAVDGGRATWVCDGDVPLAVVTQEYREPWLGPAANRPLIQLAGTLPNPHFSFRYLAQESPEDAFKSIGGDPVRLPKEAWEPSAEITWTDALRHLLNPRSRSRMR